MTEYSWQQSGLDGQRHAFPAEGGYVPKETHTAYLQVSTTLTGDAVYAAHEVEVHVAECAHVVPIACMMPQSVETADVPRCAECMRRTGTFTRPWLVLAADAHRPGARR